MGHYERRATKTSEQIQILYDRGLHVLSEDSETTQRLENIGYFKFKGYCIPYYSDKDTFGRKEDGNKYTFNDIYQSYVLDQKLHLLLLGLTNRIETQFKSRLGSFIAQKYGPLAYKDGDIFRATEYFDEWMQSVESAKAKASVRRERYVHHYSEDYQDDFPIWVILEMASFGDVSKLFSDISTEDQKELSMSEYGVRQTYITSWVHFMATVRNYCAHNSRTFGKGVHVRPKIGSRDKENYSNLGCGDIFNAFYVAGRMCKSHNFYKKTIEELEETIDGLSLADISKFGFPDDWKTCLESV